LTGGHREKVLRILRGKLVDDLNDNVAVRVEREVVKPDFPLVEINMMNMSFFFRGYDDVEVGRREDIAIQISE
jgi:hypothetical protein